MHDDPFEHGHDADDERLASIAVANNPDHDYYYHENIELTTVGIDIGSSTSHLMFSKIHLQRIGEYHSSRYVVVERKTLYRSPILLTPYTADYAITHPVCGRSSTAPTPRPATPPTTSTAAPSSSRARR